MKVHLSQKDRRNEMSRMQVSSLGKNYKKTYNIFLLNLYSLI